MQSPKCSKLDKKYSHVNSFCATTSISALSCLHLKRLIVMSVSTATSVSSLYDEQVVSGSTETVTGD